MHGATIRFINNGSSRIRTYFTHNKFHMDYPARDASVKINT